MKLSTALLALATCPQQLSAFSLNNRNVFRLQTSLNGSPQSNEENIVDKAPCYDSVCTSFPDENGESQQPATPEPLGQAIERLGVATGPTVWSEFGRIAQENPDIANLGQGFPDWLPPQFAIDALVEGATDVAHNSPHQYTRTAGHPKLVKELAGRYSRHLGREIDPFGEVAITIGASQALYLALQTLVKPGDEVIVFEPFFDLYLNQIKLAGGIPKFVPLTFKPYDDTPGAITSGEWILEPEKLHEQISDKTRAIILNSPHNPTGKIFTRTEMTMIADAVRDRCGENTVVLSDEVYKYIVHAPPKDEMEEMEAQQFQNASSTSDGSPNGDDELNYKPAICQGHVHFATLPGMEDRTITISSAGKTFSATGWQVGWAIGPEKYIAPMHQLLPYVQFCASTVIQEALARALPKADLPYEGYANYYEHLKAMYTRKRDLLGPALKDAGFAVPDYNETPGGGFFIFARIGKEIAESIPKEKLMAYNAAAPGNVARQDFALCQWMAEEKGVLCIPASPFFSVDCEKGDDGEPLSDQFVRIAFCKTNDTIKLAAANLMKLKQVEEVVSERR